jgi:membrane protein
MLIFLRVLRMGWRVLRGAVSDFRRHGCGSLAASLAYFALLSFFPMIFLIFYIIGLFVSRDQISYEFLLSFLHSFLPSLGTDLALEVKRVASEEVVRWVAFLTFMWFGMLVFYEVDYTINVVFETKRTRHALLSTAVSALLLAVVGLVFILSYALTEILSTLVRYVPRVGGIDLLAGAAHHFLLVFVLPFTGILLAVTAAYRYLPRDRPPWRDALVGGLVLTILWEVAKHLFSGYIQGLSVYGRMYGSFLAIILFLIWVYYSAALFLFGAAIVRRMQAEHLHAASP